MYKNCYAFIVAYITFMIEFQAAGTFFDFETCEANEVSGMLEISWLLLFFYIDHNPYSISKFSFQDNVL